MMAGIAVTVHSVDYDDLRSWCLLTSVEARQCWCPLMSLDVDVLGRWCPWTLMSLDVDVRRLRVTASTKEWRIYCTNIFSSKASVSVEGYCPHWAAMTHFHDPLWPEYANRVTLTYNKIRISYPHICQVYQYVVSTSLQSIVQSEILKCAGLVTITAQRWRGIMTQPFYSVSCHGHSG